MNQLLDQAAIVLVRPKYPENIGAAARVAANMGVTRIIVVHTTEPDLEPMLKMATHHAAHLVHAIKRFSCLQEALAPFTWIVGTSARKGKQRRSMKHLKTAIQTTLPHLKNNPTAILFGPEDSGLSNDDLRLCNIIATIPTADFSSLNLAQSVAIVLYELFSGVREIGANGQNIPAPPKLASSREMEDVYSLFEKTLQKIDYLKETDYNYLIHNIRHFLGRIGLRAREVKVIKGFCRHILWLAEKTHQGGRRGH